MTDAFGSEDEKEGYGSGRGGGRRRQGNGRVARWADDLIGWIRSVVAEGARGISPEATIRYDGKSNQCGRRFRGPSGARLHTFGDNYWQKFDCPAAQPSLNRCVNRSFRRYYVQRQAERETEREREREREREAERSPSISIDRQLPVSSRIAQFLR